MLDECGVVIGMVRLDRIETGLGPCLDPRSSPALSRMCDRCQSARAVKHVDDRFRRWTFSRNERGPSDIEPAIECLLNAADVAGLDHRQGDLRAADRTAALSPALLDHGPDIDRDTSLGEPRSDRFDARDTDGPLSRQHRCEALVPGVEEVPEHVQVLAVDDGRDLDTDHRKQPVSLRLSTHFRDRSRCVVIGHREDRHAGNGCALDELARCTPAVGCGGMEMEIDTARNGRRHRAARATLDP